MYNQHTRGIMTAGHRDLDERGGKTLLETSRIHIHTQRKKKRKKNTKTTKNKKKMMEKNRSFESNTEISSI